LRHEGCEEKASRYGRQGVWRGKQALDEANTEVSLGVAHGVQACAPRGIRLFSDLQRFGSVGSFIAGHKSGKRWFLLLNKKMPICLLKRFLKII
jgi:hypothetical protein